MVDTQASGEPTLHDLLTLVVKKSEGMRFSSQPVGLIAALKIPDLNVWFEAGEAIRALSKDLAETVVKDDSFLGDAGRMINTGSGAMGFYPNFLGQQLVIQAVRAGSADGAIAWLKKILETNDATGKTIQTLWGVPVAKAFSLTPDVRIVPISELADTEQRRYMMEQNFRSNAPPLITMLEHLPLESALVVNHSISPLLHDPALENHSAADFIATSELLKEIALALTIVGPRMVITGFKWFEFDDSDLSISRGYTTQILEVLPLRIEHYPLLDVDEAKEIVTAYLALSLKTRALVRVTLQRISQSLRRHSAGDAAVELSIALETLLGDSGMTEMTHKIKVRAVRLIGGSVDARIINATIINKAYSVRSRLVHTGQVRDTDTETINGERVPVRQVIDRALGLCVLLVKAIICRGEIPDWPRFDITEQTYFMT